MIDFALQHLETLKTITVCCGVAGLAMIVASWLLRRRLGAAAIRVLALGSALQSVFVATFDYRWRLQDIAREQRYLQLARSEGDASDVAAATHSLAEANAALGDFSLYGLVFGLFILAMLVVAIRPQLLASRGPRPEPAS